MADIYACSGCHKRFHAEGFKSNRLGERHKTCIECSQRRTRARTLCEHKRVPAQCVDCNGSAICEHKRRRAQCVDCNGSSICAHKRQRAKCLDCNGSSICEHKRRRAQCVDCNGSAICAHKRQRAKCVDCGGSSTCEHKRQRHNCVDCGGSSTCEHKRQRRSCRVCADPDGCIEGWFRYALSEGDLWTAPPWLDFTALELLNHIHPLLPPGTTLGQRTWRIDFVVPIAEGLPTHTIRLERMRLPNIKITPRE
jgi:hypothetical protein